LLGIEVTAHLGIRACAPEQQGPQVVDRLAGLEVRGEQIAIRARAREPLAQAGRDAASNATSSATCV